MNKVIVGRVLPNRLLAAARCVSSSSSSSSSTVASFHKEQLERLKAKRAPHHHQNHPTNSHVGNDIYVPNHYDMNSERSRFWKPIPLVERANSSSQDSDATKRTSSTATVSSRESNTNELEVVKRPTRKFQRPIYVAATRQHVGKTTTSLALMSGLYKRFEKVGFIKPVGQQHVTVYSEKRFAELRVDKDVCLVKEHFGLKHLDYEDMSPVLVPHGYTKKYVDGEISLEKQIHDIRIAMEHVSAASDVVLCEGTGHCAVGSIVGVNNARVAALLGADMVLVANGGLGSAFDELELNRVLCEHYNVNVAGVIINKVMPDKLEQTEHYMRKAMMQAWGIPLLGCIPDRPFLGCPALADLEALFQTELLSGAEHRFRHYNTFDINVVTTSLTRFLENLRNKPNRTLYICHVTRDDLIVGFMGEYQRRRESIHEEPSEAALLVCGRKLKYQLSSEVTDMLTGLQGAPVMVVGVSTHETMKMIHNFTPKLNIKDTNRVSVAIDHYEPYIDFDELLHRTQEEVEVDDNDQTT